jgi:LDH2 family malate/lactate/ureidoglycolate dehydrogenase
MKPENPIANVIDSSPISIALPAGEQPPLVMDMGGGLMPYNEEIYDRLPTSVFKAMALSAAIRSLGAVFSGIYREAYKSTEWEPNQGAFIIVIDVGHFMPIEELKREMDAFIEMARRMKPVPGMERAELAGGNEWRWERENIEKGIPMADEHCQTLQDEADELGVETPFAGFEDTRF